MRSKIKSKRTAQKEYNRYPFMNLSLKNMPGEEWIDIPQFDGYFSVSNYGRVWALPRPIHAVDGKVYYTKERIRKQHLAKYYNSFTKDYTEQLSVHIRYNGASYTYKVNRLVYELFVGGPLNFKEDALVVAHKDGDNCNNRVDNLALMNGTQLYRHGLEINRRPRSGASIKKGKRLVWSDQNSPRPIVQYSLSGKKINEFESVEQAAKAMGTFRISIRNVAQKKLMQLHGFVYRYKGDNYKGEYASFSWEKPITQYSLDGKKIALYPSVKEASAQTGINAATISKCALRKFRLASGFVWRYQGDTYRGEYRDKIKNRAKPIIQYTLDGKMKDRFPSVNQAAAKTGFSPSTLLGCAFKRTKVSHGFVWRFKGESYKGEYKYYRFGKPVTQYTLKGKKIRTYDSIQAAANAIGLTTDNIQKNVKGENKTAGGFIWRYATHQEIRKLSPFKPSKYTSIAGGKAVIQYSLEGERLAYYSSITEAAKACKINSSNISNVLDSSRYSAGGFVWRTKGNRYNGALAKMPAANKARIVTQYDLKGKRVQVFRSTKEAEKGTGVSFSTISAVARGKLKMSGGFIWQYGDGPKRIDIAAHYASTLELIKKISKPVIKYTLEGKPIAEYPSISAAARAEGIRMNSISSAINGKKKSAIGYLWKLKDRPHMSVPEKQVIVPYARKATELR